MSNCWPTSSGENVTETATREYSSGGGDFELIPDNSSVLAVIDEIQWAKDQSFNEYISVRWAVMEPESVAKRKVFQKLWVKDADPNALARGADKAEAKREKALRQLATIDLNCGGKLVRNGAEPTDDQLMLCLTNKPMVIKVRIWEKGGATGNWISDISPKGKELSLGKAAATPKAQQGTGRGQDLEGSDIPF